jgi:hypothetical protein
MNIMFARLGDLSQHPCYKLEDIESGALRVGCKGVIVGALGFVEEGFGACSPMDTAEADGTTK